MTASAVYEGEVLHRREVPRVHAFRQRAAFLYLDLDELPGLFRRRWLWSVGRRNLAWFRRADYLAPADRPLKEVALDRFETVLGRRPEGAVRLLTQVRTWGYVFNPVSFYYAFDAQGELEAVLAEITNTPWRERHGYVLDARAGRTSRGFAWRFDKDFHVSPFHPMEQEYDWRFSAPGERLEVLMTNLEGENAVFRAGLVARRRPLDGRSLARVLWRSPFQNLRLHAAIYVHAALLWVKRVPFHVHPEKREPAAGRATETT